MQSPSVSVVRPPFEDQLKNLSFDAFSANQQCDIARRAVELGYAERLHYIQLDHQERHHSRELWFAQMATLILGGIVVLYILAKSVVLIAQAFI